MNPKPSLNLLFGSGLKNNFFLPSPLHLRAAVSDVIVWTRVSGGWAKVWYYAVRLKKARQNGSNLVHIVYMMMVMIHGCMYLIRRCHDRDRQDKSTIMSERNPKGQLDNAISPTQPRIDLIARRDRWWDTGHHLETDSSWGPFIDLWDNKRFRFCYSTPKRKSNNKGESM